MHCRRAGCARATSAQANICPAGIRTVGFLHKSIEIRLSALLGIDVRFEKVSFSLLGGSIDVQGLVIGGNEAVIPFATIRRVRAEFALAAALKKEFVIKSLTLE